MRSLLERKLLRILCYDDPKVNCLKPSPPLHIHTNISLGCGTLWATWNNVTLFSTKKKQINIFRNLKKNKADHGIFLALSQMMQNAKLFQQYRIDSCTVRIFRTSNTYKSPFSHREWDAFDHRGKSFSSFSVARC